MLIIERKAKTLSPYEQYLQMAERSPLPVTPNPIKELRTQGKLTNDPDFDGSKYSGLTQESFGILCGLSKYAIIRIEQGIFGSVPDKLLTKLNLPYNSVTNQYDLFVETTRKRNHKVFGHALGNPVTYYGLEKTHPLVVLMEEEWCYPDSTFTGNTLNVTELSKLLCLNQSHINRFVTSKAPQKTVPGTLLNALSVNGYSRDDINYFSEVYRKWRNS